MPQSVLLVSRIDVKDKWCVLYTIDRSVVVARQFDRLEVRLNLSVEFICVCVCPVEWKGEEFDAEDECNGRAKGHLCVRLCPRT